jgi:hypothetical protein
VRFVEGPLWPCGAVLADLLLVSAAGTAPALAYCQSSDRTRPSRVVAAEQSVEVLGVLELLLMIVAAFV